MNKISNIAGGLLLTAAALLLQPAGGQVLFSAGNYSQNFDTLSSSGTANTWTENSTLLGWYASRTNTGTPSSVATYRADTGAGNTGALYSFGVAGTGPATDRALGSISSGNATVGNLAYGVRFANDTALEITNITISYTGEQWRNGGNVNAQMLAFSYRFSNSSITDADSGNSSSWTSFSALDFQSPVVGATAAVLDGNAAANRQVFSSVLLPGVVVLPGWEIFFRWYDVNDTGSDHGLAIDDFSVAFTMITPTITAPTIDPSGQPQSRTNNAGTTAAFTVTAGGTAPSYQWRKNGADIFDGGNVFGTATPTLTVTNVLAADAAGYSVFVNNTAGSITSHVATLTVIDPAINNQPDSRTNVAGDTANFFATAAGTPGLGYQWRFNGADIPGETGASLNLPNAQPANQGPYTLVVGNGNGDSITSSVANLTLLSTPSTLLARWDFDATNSFPATAPAPSSGTGSASLSSVTATFGTGSFSDPAGAPGAANSGWNTTSYPNQGTGNKTAGVQFNVSTMGYQSILLTWEERHSDASSKYTRLQYSTDGTTFLDGPSIVMEDTNNAFIFYSANLSAIPDVNNNPNFAFRVVSEWESTATGNNNDNYVATVSSYNTGGTIRFDVFNAFGNVFGTVTPIPLSIQKAGTNVILSWTDPAFSLTASTVVTGTYNKIIGATSPYTNAVIGPAKYFRLVSP